jgi:hypothetical protein
MLSIGFEGSLVHIVVVFACMIVFVLRIAYDQVVALWNSASDFDLR